MFGWAFKFNADLSQWDTSNAVRMDAMFFGAVEFDGNLSLWDVSRVTNMACVFFFSSEFRGGDLTQWNVSSVVDTDSMFGSAVSFNGNVSPWDTGRVTDMERTVSHCEDYHPTMWPGVY
jgi:surface protein